MIIKKNMYVIECGYTDDNVRLSEFNEGNGNVVYGTVEVQVEFDMPSKIAIRDLKVSTIKDCIQEERAYAQIKVKVLEERIQQLMALGVDDE